MSGSVRILSHLPLGLLERVGRDFPAVEIEQIPEEGAIPESATGEILLTQAWGSPNLADVLARGVRWVHTYGTGVDRFPFETLEGRPLTCSRGASAIPIAEWVFAVMLAAAKRLPDSFIHEPPEQWNRGWPGGMGGLSGKTLGLIGIGGIGIEVARRALAFDMRVLALRRTSGAPPIAGIEVSTDLGDVLERADQLVVAAPATPQTRHMLDAQAFARMKPEAHLINVSRGELVDHEALRAALDQGQLALASLDTVEPEPLPDGHWLYTHPKVRLSPHISWSMPGALDWLLVPFIENLGRYLAGEPLENRVDLEQGY